MTTRALPLALALVGAGATALRAEAPAIDHREVKCIVAGKFPRMDACFLPAEVVQARVYFRSEGTATWYYVDMKRVAGQKGYADVNPAPGYVSGVLPRPSKKLVGKRVDYYVEASDKWSEVAALRQDPRFNVFTYAQRGYQFIGWNTRDPLFREPETRLAMTLAIDRQRILDALVFGEGKVAAHPVMSQSPFYASDIAPHPYDPERAKALLATAGWKDTNGDGILDRNQGEREYGAEADGSDGQDKRQGAERQALRL